MHNTELLYVPGDHVGVFPANQSALVDRILTYLHNAPPADQPVTMEVLKETTTPFGECESRDVVTGVQKCS